MSKRQSPGESREDLLSPDAQWHHGLEKDVKKVTEIIDLVEGAFRSSNRGDDAQVRGHIWTTTEPFPEKSIQLADQQEAAIKALESAKIDIDNRINY